MKVRINRPAALGAAAALLFAPLAAVPAAGPATAVPAPTSLSAAQARAALREALKTTAARGARQGMREIHVAESPKGRHWHRDTEVLVVDPATARASVSVDVKGWVEPYDDIDNLCDVAGKEPVRRTMRVVYKSGVGSWTHLTPTKNERDALKLVHRTKARWVKSTRSATTLRTAIRAWGVNENLDLDSPYLDDMKVRRASVTPTATGKHYSINLSDDYDAEFADYFAITFDIGADGSISTATWRTSGASTFDYANTYRITYGKQRAASVPAKPRVLARATFDRGCRADLARDLPREAARGIAKQANEDAKYDHRKTRVGDIGFRALRDKDSVSIYGAVRVTKIRYGVKIVGRSPLLAHPYVSTVFIRSGKAVTNRVR